MPAIYQTPPAWTPTIIKKVPWVFIRSFMISGVMRGRGKKKVMQILEMTTWI